MVEGVIAFLIFAGISSYCWALVLRPKFRQRMSEPVGGWRRSKQERADMDAVSLASALVGALFFSMITVVFGVVVIYRFLVD
jgi:hypothetical protein